MGWHVFELITDLTTVFTRTGIAAFKYVQNTRILKCCHFGILKQIPTSVIFITVLCILQRWEEKSRAARCNYLVYLLKDTSASGK